MKKLASVLLAILLLLQLMPFAAAEEAEHVHGTPEITAEETVPDEELSPAAEEPAEKEEDPVPDGDPAALAEPADPDVGETAPSDAAVPARPEEEPDETLPADDDAAEELPAEEAETATLPEEEAEILDVQEPRDAAGDTKATSLPTKMWVEASDTNGIPMQIDVFRQSSTGYTCILCLPGSAVLSECYFSWDGGLSVTYSNKTYASGACPIPTTMGTQTTYTFRKGTSTRSFKITAYQGSSSVPSIFIDIDESEGNPTIAQMDGDANHEVTCTGHIYINGPMYDMPKIKGRGNYTWSQADDKKAYNITLGTKIKFPGLDSAKTKKWSILAEISDHSLMCNRSGFSLAHQLGIGQDTVSADVWMNGEYQGCYTVTPKYDSFVTDDGYLLEEDNYLETVSIEDGGDPQFELEGMHGGGSDTSNANLITVKEIGKNLLGTAGETPENIRAVTDQIHAWMQDAWDAIRSSTGYNSKGKYYTDYIDVESFAKMYLMHEYVKSYDVCAGSILFHRDGTSDSDKLIAGPLWDLDNAMGSTQSNNGLGSVADRRSGKGAFITEIITSSIVSFPSVMNP